MPSRQLFSAALSLLVVCISASAFAQDPKDRHSRPPARPGVETSAHACPGSFYDPLKPNDSTFVVDCAPALDTGCSFRSDGPLIFTIPITRVVGDVQKLKQAGLISPTALLQMPALDVDFAGGLGINPELDRVTFNGHVVPGEFLTGMTDIWKLNQFSIPIEWVNFPSDPGPDGTVAPADNVIRIDIDTANSEEVWCTAIDWASLSFEVARPVVMAHGILSDGGTWAKSEFSWVQRLGDLGLPNSNRLSMGRLDSIQNNAAKINVEVASSLRRWGVDRVNLVCHSKGGLDAREYASEFLDATIGSVDQLIQLGTPNAGSPLADYAQLIAAGGVGIPGAIIINELAGPAGYQLTTPYMLKYNFDHFWNPAVKYIALAGDYDPDCFFLNPFCRPIERFLLSKTGPGDTIVPIASVHALSFTENRIFHSSGDDKQATHTSLTNSPGVFNAVMDRVTAPGRNSFLPREELPIRAAKPTTTAMPATFVSTASTIRSISQGEIQTGAIPIEQATPATFALFYSAGNLDLALISPSGLRYDAGNVTGNPNVAFEDREILGGRLESFSFTSPEVGQWTVEVSAPSVIDPSGSVAYAVSGWLENAEITFTGSPASTSIRAGENLRLLGTLKQGGSPLAGATVTARIIRPDNSTGDAALRDDGTNGDAMADDGIYTADFPSTSQPGTYRIAFTASRAATAGEAPFSRAVLSTATVSANSSSFDGFFRDFGVDTDGDAFFDQLVIELGVKITAAANYRVFAELRDSQGHTQTRVARAALTPGSSLVSLIFDGATIYKNGNGGPYQLATLRLAEERDQDVLPIEERPDAYQTVAYDVNQFQHSAISLTGVNSAVGVDADGNGLFDQLDVGIGVNVINDGYYEWSARLVDQNGTELGFVTGFDYLTAGPNTLVLAYPGTTIGSNGVDGPYLVRGLLVLGLGINGGLASLVVPDVFTTGAFTASQFDGFMTLRNRGPVKRPQ